jgi:LysR family transcriptional activator of mexEF-oprN operon
MPRLLRRLQQTAPGIRVVVRPLQRQAVAQMLDQGDIDLACGRLGELPKWQTRERLLDVGFLCLYDGKRLKIRKPISLARFLELPHLLFSAGGDMEGVVDRVLATRNLQRKVIYATSSFSVMPALLKQVDAIATLPEYTAREFAADSGLRISPAPIPLPRYPSSLAWLSQRRDDPAHTWLREEIKGIIARMVKAGG